MSKLLIDERPMMVLPSLAARIGLDEAVVLQQIHYWLDRHEEVGHERTLRDGRWWVYNTVEEWQSKQFKWWSLRTVRRILEFLEKSGLISTAKFEQTKWVQRKWYTINYEVVEAIANLSEETGKLDAKARLSAIIEHAKTHLNPHGCAFGQNGHIDSTILATSSISKITPEITSKLHKGDENRPREKNVSTSDGSAKSGKNAIADPVVQSESNHSVKSSIGGRNQKDPQPPVPPAPLPPRLAALRSDENGIIRFPDSGADKLAGRLALRSVQVWLCATALEFKFKREGGRCYAYDPLVGDWDPEREMFDEEMPIGKIISLLFNYTDCAVTIDDINEEMLDWFRYWKDFIKGRTLPKGEYFSVIPHVLKWLEKDWDEESA